MPKSDPAYQEALMRYYEYCKGDTGEFGKDEMVTLQIKDAYGKTYQKQVPGSVMNNPRSADEARRSLERYAEDSLDKQFADEEFERKVKSIIAKVVPGGLSNE